MEKIFPHFDTETQNQAMVNQFKGHLFEFLVAEQLARSFSLQGQFLQQCHGELKQQLRDYESWLRQYYPGMLSALPRLAQATSQALLPQLSKLALGPAQGVELRGLVHEPEHQDHQDYKEADILVHFAKGACPISLKLAKQGSFVNTKSAGILSFLQRYWGASASSAQEGLSRLVHNSFLQLGHELYELVGEEFTGSFDSAWQHSHLPGQLPPEMRHLINQHYHRLILPIHQFFGTQLALPYHEYAPGLCELLGLGHEGMLQIICYHADDYALANFQVLHATELATALAAPRLAPLGEEKASFDIYLGPWVLQIRVKPMNRFTTPGVKVNCSIKQKSSTREANEHLSLRT